jgi:hypothetical protein
MRKEVKVEVGYRVEKSWDNGTVLQRTKAGQFDVFRTK